MEENKQVYPYDDDAMAYDLRAHRYVLRRDYVKDVLGLDLAEQLNTTGDYNPNTASERFLQRLSQSVYLWLYSQVRSKDWLEFMLAKYPPLRERVLEMLEAQLRYVGLNGFVGDYAGINVERGQSMDIAATRGRARVAPEVEDICEQDIPGFGFCLVYRGRMPCVPCGKLYEGY